MLLQRLLPVAPQAEISIKNLHYNTGSLVYEEESSFHGNDEAAKMIGARIHFVSERHTSVLPALCV